MRVELLHMTLHLVCLWYARNLQTNTPAAVELISVGFLQLFATFL